MNQPRPRFAWVLGWAIPPEWFRPMAEAALPAAQHVLVEPSPATWDELQAAGPFDWVVGYSLGSLILLQDSQRASALGRVALLAPIWAFPTEAAAGGRIPRGNLRALARAYRSSPVAALESFYQTAGLSDRIEGSGSGSLQGFRGVKAQRRRVDEVERDLRGALGPTAFRPEQPLSPTRPSSRPPNGEVALHPGHETLEAFRYPIPQGKEAAAHLWGLEQLEKVQLSPSLPPSWHAWTGQNDALLDATRQQTLVSALTIVPGATHHPAELIAAFSAAST